MNPLFLVLRKSHEYDVDYVKKLAFSLHKHSPNVKIYCLSDVPLDGIDGVTRLPLITNWPAWWAKIETFFIPSEMGTIAYMDLDTVVTGSIGWLCSEDQTHLLSDLYRPEKAQSGVMILSLVDRLTMQDIVKREGMAKIMKQFRGDGEFIAHCMPHAKRLQDSYPGQIVSYKADKVAKRGVPKGASIVCFHGQPRPRDVDWKV